MPRLSLLFRFHTLPILVFFISSLLSWIIFEYQSIQENKQFQMEYNSRAGGHTAAFQLGLEDMSTYVDHLAHFLAHEANSDDGGAFKSNKNFTDFIDMFFAGNNEARDVIWYESEADIKDALLDSPRSRVLHVLHSNSQWHSQSMANIPAIMTVLKRVIQDQKLGSFVVLDTMNQPWIYEVIPIRSNGKDGCLLVAWDVGVLIEYVLSKVPVGGQDIHYDFGKAIVLGKKTESGVIHLTTDNAEYVHLSRSRQSDKTIGDQRHFYWQDELHVFGRAWRIRYVSAPAFLESHPVVNAWNVLYGGLLISVLLALLTLLVYRRARMIEGLVNIRTQQLRGAQKRIHLLVDSLAEGLLDMDKKGACTFINQRALDLLGYQCASQVVGQNVHEFIHHSDSHRNIIAHEHCKIIAVMHTGKAIRVADEVFWRADDSAIAVSYNATPVYDDTNTIVSIAVSFLDISAQVAAEQEREQMRKQVEHIQRLESLGMLAGGIAHDFNNLLTSVIGNADLALHHLDPTSPVIKHLNGIHKASHHAADLCKQMLAYSGKCPLMMDSLNISELVRDIGKLLDISTGKHVEVGYKLANPIRLIHADKTQAQQIVMNLLINANEAIGDKEGKVTMTTGMMNVDRKFLSSCYADKTVLPGDYVFVDVRDNGCGMDKTTLDRMFEPFFTTKFTGRGLGMSAILGIVRSHAGAVFVQSEEGKGTCIRVLFPSLESESLITIEQDVKASHAVDLVKHEGLILVVDDEEILREIAGMMLEDMGYQVVFAENGLQALDVFSQHIDDIDLVLLDLTMPKMGGEACMEALRDLRGNVPILITSGYSEEQCTKFDNFLAKPYSEDLFQEKVNAALHQ